MHFIAFGWFMVAGVLRRRLGVTVMGLSIAQFRAYHDIRGQLIEAQDNRKG